MGYTRQQKRGILRQINDPKKLSSIMNNAHRMREDGIKGMRKKRLFFWGRIFVVTLAVGILALVAIRLFE